MRTKKILKHVAVTGIILALAGGLFPAAFSIGRVEAAVSGWQKGITVMPRYDWDFASDGFKQSINDAAAANVNFVALVIPYYQSNVWSSDIHRGWNTPPDEALISAIDYVHSKGMKVMLKPHLDTYDGQWRAQINAGNRNEWYANYQAMLLHYANLAKNHGVEQMCVGAELIKMSAGTENGDNTWRWMGMIAKVREVYSGQLTYSANWGGPGFPDEKNHIAFWSSLDYIGISAYFGLGNEYWNYDISHLKGHWDQWKNNDIKPLSDKWSKPVLFTEIGYKSVRGAHTEPWNYNFGGPTDEDEQANAYEALFSYWNDHSWMQGVFLWDWDSDPNAGGNWTQSYTPQNKRAESVMTSWFGTGAPSPTVTPSPSPTVTPTPSPFVPSISASATVHPSNNPNLGQPMTITTRITNHSQPIGNTVVDVEIYDNSNGFRIFQKFFENQSFETNLPVDYPVQWSATRDGTYTVTAGVFNRNWTTTYLWKDTATITVGQSSPTPTPSPTPSPTPTPGPASIDIWWPGNQAQVGGTQPFKAMVTNRDAHQYAMAWQVDGDRLNEMYTSDQDWPHKEAWVDLSGWTWKNEGPYTINFVATEFGGTLIAEKSIDIFVLR